MLGTVVLLQLILWTTATHAFYPWFPAWVCEKDDSICNSSDSPEDVAKTTRDVSPLAEGLTLKLSRRRHGIDMPLGARVARQAERFARRHAAAATTPPATATAELAKRANTFAVVTAATPAASNAVGIDQDGTDFSYFVQATLGSNKTPMYMLLDSGAGTTWVMGTDCTSSACALHNSFGAANSSSLKKTGNSFSIAYGSGTVAGNLANDDITVAGISVNMMFGLANKTSNDFSHFPFDGILGLSLSKGVTNNFWQVVMDGKLVDSNIFGISIWRDSDGGSNNGELTIGTTDSSQYTGNIGYTAVDSSANGDWAIAMGNIGFDGSLAGVTDRLAYIDTGTTYMFGPKDDVAALHALIPGASTSDGGTTYTAPCNTDLPLTVVFSGVSYNISSEDWLSSGSSGNCTSNVYGREVVSGAWLFGDLFLKNVYTVFDVDKTRIVELKGVLDSQQHVGKYGVIDFGRKWCDIVFWEQGNSDSGGGIYDGPDDAEDVFACESVGGKQGRHSGMHKGDKGTDCQAAVLGSDMAGAQRLSAGDGEESVGLLASGPGGDEGLAMQPGSSDDSVKRAGSVGLGLGLVTTEIGGLSSLRSPLTPRTPNRVRFDLTPQVADFPVRLGDSWPADGRRSQDSSGSEGYGGRDSFDVDVGAEEAARQHRLPLLTGMEAPTVATARTGSFLGGDDGDDGDDDRAGGDPELWAAQERRRPKSGLGSAFMNMANSIIGAGIIGQPYALRQAGLASGVVLLVALTAVVDWTIRLIVVNSKLSGASSFQGTVEHCFGRPGLVAISLAQWVFAFGGMVAFGVIVGDSIPHVLLAIWPALRDAPVVGLLADRRVVIALCLGTVSYPLTLYRDIAKLAKASTFALVSMSVIIVTVLVQGALVPAQDRGSFSRPLLTVNTGIFQAIGVISFAFVCHHNSLLIYGSLKTPTIDRFARVTHVSTGVSMVACLIMALAGFLTFGDRTLGNVLNNFPADNTMVNVARLCFGLNMLTTLPLEAFVCREVMFNYFFPGAPFNMRLHILVSTGLVAAAMGLSLVTCDLGAIFELVGATSACAMAYILPPLCYIKLTTRSWRTYMAAAIVVFGCSVMGISLLQALHKIIKGRLGPRLLIVLSRSSIVHPANRSGEGGTAQCR
ncbi:aspartic-type endopeptidase [Grosmannia clavigera kw1407]|uniref:Aspartic-type endopeptidase n=1 Tax=Grosmannia clavigera (strain kw1407 / UAMH 11150) TaxID=655863 RepID=F0XTN2_GROCL|nr:aspartic-type endopeptidase [Grosmannia clavigera kw1407]EFW99045.1 aspartic-type endopeptidase [Grosmannia clavigera kw1407]